MLSVKDMLHHGFSYDACKYISEEDYNDMLKSDCVPLVNDVLIAKDGSYLKHVFVIKEEKKQGILSSIGILRPNLKKINPEYLKYYLHSNSVKVTVAKKYVSGSALPRIILKNFGEIDVIYKPLIEQQKIAKVLSDLDSKIELNNRINTELEAMAKTLYDYWFVQFDFPDANGKAYKTSGGKMVWNEELKREIPEGWEMKIVDVLLAKETTTTKIPTSEILEKGLIPVIDQSTNYIKGYTNDKRSVITTDKARILFGDHTRILKLINFDFARGADGTQVLLSKNEKMPQHLFFHSLLKIDLSNYGYARHFKFLKDAKIIIPSKKTAIEFEEIVSGFYNKIKSNIFQNQELASLRDWLLPMLMNGQVSVGEVEEELGMVAEESPRYGK
ncbi:restriction endonuclease subunit S [Flavobacterium sp. LS1P28]|uniref:restriction endonuclease subunit S n=1 Tax=Flavobacterium sp. LS1P28 TaxID=2497752 RepID=UPI00131556E5|nr:restriction endonuclease subunit S [Flavobacterium sp. LS1P28]